MNRHLHAFRRSALLASIALACAGVAQAQTMSGSEHQAAKERIEADYKVAKAACNRLTGNAADICEAEAKGQEEVARAELEHRRSGRAEDARKVALAKADAAYEVAKERCDDRSGNDRDICMKEAKAVHTRMKNDAQAGSTQSAAARQDAVQDQRDADYKVALEKCDSLSGAAKSDCQNAAKARFGKS
jgi:hypothetical protein